MKQLTSAQDAIGQAIDGGFNFGIHTGNGAFAAYNASLLDPLFWQALGKTQELLSGLGSVVLPVEAVPLFL